MPTRAKRGAVERSGARAVLLAILMTLPTATALPLALPPVDLGGAARVFAGDVTYTHTTLDLVGTNVVAPGARLTLDGATVRFHAAELIVAPGGRLDAIDSRFIDPDVLSLGSSHLVGGEWTGANATGLTVADGGKLSVAGAFFHDLRAGITVRDTTHAAIERNLFANVSGVAPIVVQGGGALANTIATASTIEENLILENTGARAIYLGGASAATRVSANAIAASYLGIEAADGAGGLIRANRLVGFGDAALEGLRVNGTVAAGSPRATPRFSANRVEGFAEAAHVAGTDANDTPRFSRNALLGATGLAAESPADARANWWGDASGPADADATDGSAPATNPGLGAVANGPVDYARWLGADPTADAPVSLTAFLDADGLHVLITNTKDADATVTLLIGGAAGEPARHVEVHVVHHVTRIDAPFAGTSAPVLARADFADGTSAVAAATVAR
ncbi:MAG: hypothetical protein ACYDCK_02845 [Thermoplasmatota archaeon]